MKVNVNPVGNELSRLKDTNKNYLNSKLKKGNARIEMYG